MSNMIQKLGNSQNIIFLLGIIVYGICLFTITDIDPLVLKIVTFPPSNFPDVADCLTPPI